jgi:hypothetical protein
MHCILLIYIVGRATWADCSSIMLYVSMWWILRYIWWLWWILWNAYYACDFWWFLYVQNKKNAKDTLPCVFGKAHGKVTGTAGRNRTFAVRFRGKHTTKGQSLPCVFRLAHNKAQSLLCVFGRARGKGRFTPFATSAVSYFFSQCASLRRTTKIVHHALSETVHDNATLPCKNLPCALCRAPMKNARQRLCCAPGAHGKPRLSRNDECVWNI